MSFENLNLHPKILKAVTEAGYTQPTAVQLEAMPKIMEGHDVRASAQTGTGKTAAFLLPALHRLSQSSNKRAKGPKVLILAPTRELAMQISTQAEKYSKYLDCGKSVCIGGGVPYPLQLRKLARPYDILIATPGRLIDFMERGKIDLSNLEMLVLDEADRMLDMGFIEPVETIVAETPDERQTILFSATLQGDILKLSNRLMKNPVEVVIAPEQTSSENVEQKVHFADDLSHKNNLLYHILGQDDVDHAIVFTSTKKHADQLVDELLENGFSSAALHGDMSQRQRTKTLGQLRTGKVKILVATDVAARGIDVKSITHVINFDLPRNAEDYVHRIGRTGRAGATGTALSFVTRRDAFLLKKIEKFTGQPITVEEIAGLEPKDKGISRASEPRKGGRGGFGGPSRSSSGRSRFGGSSDKPYGKSSQGRFGAKSSPFQDKPRRKTFGAKKRFSEKPAYFSE